MEEPAPMLRAAGGVTMELPAGPPREPPMSDEPAGPAEPTDPALPVALVPGRNVEPPDVPLPGAPRQMTPPSAQSSFKIAVAVVRGDLLQMTSRSKLFETCPSVTAGT